MYKEGMLLKYIHNFHDEYICSVYLGKDKRFHIVLDIFSIGNGYSYETDIELVKNYEIYTDSMVD